MSDSTNNNMNNNTDSNIGFKKGDKFILEIGDRQLDEFEIAGTDYYIKIYLLKMLTPYKPDILSENNI